MSSAAVVIGALSVKSYIVCYCLSDVVDMNNKYSN